MFFVILSSIPGSENVRNEDAPSEQLEKLDVQTTDPAVTGESDVESRSQIRRRQVSEIANRLGGVLTLRELARGVSDEQYSGTSRLGGLNEADLRAALSHFTGLQPDMPIDVFGLGGRENAWLRRLAIALERVDDPALLTNQPFTLRSSDDERAEISKRL